MNTVTAVASSAYESPTERLKAWVEGAVLHLSFNNVAKHNAISVDMWEVVSVLLEQAEKDDEIRMEIGRASCRERV